MQSTQPSSDVPDFETIQNIFDAAGWRYQDYTWERVHYHNIIDPDGYAFVVATRHDEPGIVSAWRLFLSVQPSTNQT